MFVVGLPATFKIGGGVLNNVTFVAKSKKKKIPKKTKKKLNYNIFIPETRKVADIITNFKG